MIPILKAPPKPKPDLKTVQSIIHNLMDTGYQTPQLARIFGTTELMITRLLNPRCRPVSPYFLERILNVDLATIPSPEPASSPRRATRQPHQFTATNTIRVPRRDMPDLPASDRDPVHHARHWYNMGFSIPEIAALAGISAGDAERAINGYTVGTYAGSQLVKSFATFTAHLVDKNKR